MAIAFPSPSQRAAGGDLAIQVSPLGLVELADEEFEVHGPRLNRYAQGWAFYLGHHWSYQKPAGEPQIVVNYTRALSDWVVNFAFGRGVDFVVDKQYQHIIPALLDRVWNVDNNKKQTCWEIGNQGSVQGDAFVKVAYEPAYQNAMTGNLVPGRVRILPLNASFCFPRWHPHDRERLVEFKLKYRFWGDAGDGSRQVNTYVEVINDEWICEYVNDLLIDRRPNVLGEIPVVHIANKQASASPWGLSDVIDLIPLNRQYNELFTDVIDILNYHVAPVTILKGMKASNLEKGANKIWGLPKDGDAFNLDGGAASIQPALETLDRIKIAMHEMMAVPETALGQAQPISNTSGVALAIQFLPSMNMFEQKKTQYSPGLEKVNKLCLKNLFTFEPETMEYNPETDGIWEGPESEQPPVVDPADPTVYITECKWASPLPVDMLIGLQEIQLMFALGLESKKGALKRLGEPFPDEKMQELFDEQIADAQQAAAKQILSAHIAALTMELTGIVPEGAGEPVEQPTPDANGNMPPKPDTPAGVAGMLPSVQDVLDGLDTKLFANIVQQAFSSKTPSRRIIPDSSDE